MDSLDFQALTEASPVQIWTAGPDGALDYVNATVTRFFGRSSAQMLGEGWLGFLHPADVTLTIERWTRSIVHGEVYNMEFRLLRASDRQYYWHLAQAEPIRDASGRVVRWVGSNTDINGLRRMVEVADARQETARRERDRLYRSFELAPMATALCVGPDFVVEMGNQKWRELHGKDSAVSKPLRDVVSTVLPAGNVQPLLEQVERVYATGQAETASLRLPAASSLSGDETLLYVLLQPMRDAGGGVNEILIQVVAMPANSPNSG